VKWIANAFSPIDDEPIIALEKVRHFLIGSLVMEPVEEDFTQTKLRPEPLG
jgi:hypothetical protein